MAKKISKFWIIISVIFVIGVAGVITLAVLLNGGHSHELVEHAERLNTCTEDGNIEYWECTVCNKYFTDSKGKHPITLEETVLLAKGHNYENDVCTRCGHVYVPATNLLDLREVMGPNGKAEGYTVAGMGTSTATEVVIPEVYNDMPVVQIMGNAFRGNERIKSVTIPSSITSIGTDAFVGCTSLTDIFVSDNRNYTSENGVLYTKDKSVLLCYPAGKSDTVFTLPDQTQTVGNAFVDAVHLEQFVMTDASKCTKISSSAFLNCAKLNTVKLSDSLTTIEEGAFSGCAQLNNITLPFVGSRNAANGGYPLGYIFGTKSYAGGEPTAQEHLSADGNPIKTTYYIPSSLKSVTVLGGALPYGAFYGCGNLQEVNLKNVTAIGSYAFSGCHLVEITIPATVSVMNENALGNCFPTTIRCEAFGSADRWHTSWNSSQNPVVWHCEQNSLANDGNVYVVFKGLRFALKNGEATVALQSKALKGAVSIPTSISYDSQDYNVTAIAVNAFRGCSIHEITIPQSVVSVGSNALKDCGNLLIRLQAAAVPPTFDVDWNSDDCPILTDCDNTEVAEDGSVYYLENGVRYALKEGAATVISHEKNTEIVTIPSVVTYKGKEYNVTTIGKNAFADTVTKITLPESITTLNDGAFANCKCLTELKLPQSVTKIGNGVFMGCAALTVYSDVSAKPDTWQEGWNKYSDVASCPVVWDSSANDIADNGKVYFVINGVRYAIVGDGKAKVVRQSLALSGVVTVPNTVKYKEKSYSVTDIESYAFSDCNRLTGIKINNGITNIGEYAFSNCTLLNSVELPEGISVVKMGCFEFCSDLQKIVIPKNVKTLDFNAFLCCSKLREVVFAEGSMCEVISSGVFYNCYALEHIVIPQSVVSIGKNTFRSCTALKNVEFVDANGWWYSAEANATYGTAVPSEDFSDVAKAAELLVQNTDKYWKKSTKAAL